jgi:segregation and condensation protein A
MHEELQLSASFPDSNSNIGPDLNVSSDAALSAAPAADFSPIEQAVNSLAATEGGIEFLIKLAETGQIDPADVDIIEVTDRFLKAIAAAPKENLRQSGKVLFHASVLLRLKAEALLERKFSGVTDGTDDFLDFDADGSPIIYDSSKQPIARQITLEDLENALVRRANNRQNRQRKVSLEQLVAALQDAERIERVRGDRKAKPRIQMSGYHDVQNVDDILDLAHDEDIEVVIKKVELILSERLSIGQSIALVDLIKLLGQRNDWVDAFLAILFLSNTGKIVLDQTSFYGPVQIVRCQPPQTLESLQVSA